MRHSIGQSPGPAPAVPRGVDGARKAPWPWGAGAWFVAFLSAYSLLHVVVRVVISPSAELDEGEQLVLTQSLALGYAYTPPLYTWLQSAFFAVFGVNIFALALFKNLLLLFTHLFLFLAARMLLREAALAVLASLSLWLLPAIAWESHRDLTHSVLAMCLAAGSLYVALRLSRGGMGQYALLGFLLGLGVLSKYNFVLFAAGLVVAAAWDAGTRPWAPDRRMVLAGAIAAAVVVPHLWWVLAHPPVVTARAAEALGPDGAMGRLLGVVTGVGRLVRAVAVFLTPFWLVCVALLPRAFAPAAAPQDERSERLFERFFLVVLTGLVVVVLAQPMARFPNRWLLPLLFVVPLYVFVRLEHRGLGPGRRRAYGVVVALFGLGLLVAPLAQVSLGPRLGFESRLHIPFARLAMELRSAGFSGGTIVAENRLLGGNLRLAFPGSRILVPELAPAGLRSPHGPGQCLVVWPARDEMRIPPAVRGLIERLQVPPAGTPTPRYLEASLLQSQPRAYRLGFLLFPRGIGECR